MGNGQRHPFVNPGVWVGVALVWAGTLLFLNNLNITQFNLRALFWPSIFLFYGGSVLYKATGTISRVVGGTALLAGTLLMLDRFGIFHFNDKALWPLALIAAGVILLLQRMPNAPLAFGSGTDANSGDRLHEFAVFSGIKRRVLSQNFEGGDISCTFGGIEIDLRRAGVSPATKEVVLEANAAFGGIEIRVPDTWRVSIQGTAIFGGYDDKTLPPRPEPGVEAPLLIIRGGTAFGGVSIQN